MSHDLRLGPRGESLIKSFEQLRLAAYMPTPNDRPTIGWGHTAGVKLGTTINQFQAQAFFDLDVMSSVAAVNSLPCRLTQSMFDALVSLVFNVGAGAIKPGSTIGTALRGGIEDGHLTGSGPGNPYFAAWAGFALWRKQAGKDLLGLARRRAREMELYWQDGLP